ncbi:unnamed protein product [Linum tenue]|uniref:KIB1-4 beta-propeller domain-containing protein n=1 Tax=Linum tenue TaxID=586396 RepID=A0AAV0R571_9ROSI|nr:unnamed protein product [Linum tenue]
MRWRLLDATKRPAAFMDNPRNMAYLLECNGELISIVVGPIGEFVRVYKFFNLTYSWQVVDDLKDQMVFCSPTGCVALMSNEAQGTGLENTVHFPRFHERRHVFYSLSTEQFHSFEPGYPSIDFCDTKLLLNRTWMIPSFQFFSLQQLHWSSKPKKQLTSKKDADVGLHHIHPHYVIRSLTFRSSGDPSACAELEDYEKGRKQESPTTQAFLVLSNHEGERMLVNLAKVSAVSHSRIIGLEARMRGKKVYSSAHGLLVLMDHEARSCSLLDPVSMVETTSPTWERRFDCLFVVLHLPPGESKFVVMVFGVAKSDREIEGTESNLEAKNDALAMLWRDGDSEWTILTTPSEQGVEFNAVAVLNLGKIYGYLVMKSELVSVELQPETYITRVLPELDYPDFPKGAGTMVISLVECRGEILLFVRYDALGYETPRLRVVIDMQVYKMDMEMMRWIRIDDLGDLAFLWSNTWGCYPCHASKSGLKRNSVYFFQPKEKYLYRFDCGDGSISVSKPYPDLDDSWSPNEFIMWDNQIL